MNHHAELYIASSLPDAGLEPLYLKQSADIVHVLSDAFGIDDARSLTKQAYIRPVEQACRTCVVVFKTATTEAQNALLKLLEDPPATTRFIVIASRKEVLIPTLQSRLQLRSVSVSSGTESIAFSKFQEASYKERLAQIAAYAKTKDTLWLQDLQAGLLDYAAGVEDITTARVLVLVDQNLNRRGASNKMLLEELALSLPIGV